MTLPNLMEVCLESVAELVYVEVFKNMKVRSDLKILAFCFFLNHFMNFSYITFLMFQIHSSYMESGF